MYDFKKDSYVAYFFLIIFIITAIVYLSYISKSWGIISFFSCGEFGKGKDILVEIFGFLLDIILFGFLLYLFTDWRDRKIKIQNYQEQLSRMLRWEDKGAINNKVELIKKLNQLKAPLPHLQDIYLVDAYVKDVNLKGALLHGSIFRGASLFNIVILEEADISHTCFKQATLGSVNLKNANLSDSEFYEANLNRCNLEGADLRDSFPDINKKKNRFKDTNFTGAKFNNQTDLRGCDLSLSIGMTKEQYETAKTDENTIPPQVFWD